MAKSLNFKSSKSALNFTVQNENKHPNDDTVIEISLEDIVELPQDFVIHEDTVELIAESIKRDGQYEPCIVTPSKNPGKYDLLSGRHRCRACKAAGLSTAKCIVRQCKDETDKQLTILNTNLNRNNDYLPSELAFAYKHKFELLKETTDGSAMQVIAEENKISRKKVQRYIRLTKLIKPLLNRVDSGSIPLIAGVQLANMTEKEQGTLFEYLINHSDCKVTTGNAVDIRLNINDLDKVFYPEDEDEEDEFGEAEINEPEAIEPEIPVSNKDVVVDTESIPPTPNTPEQSEPVWKNADSFSSESSEVDNLSTQNEDDNNSEIDKQENEFVNNLKAKAVFDGKSFIRQYHLSNNSFREFMIDCYGLCFLCIFGRHISGRAFTAIVNHGISVELSIDDIGYNKSRFAQALDSEFCDDTLDKVSGELARIITKELSNGEE